LWKKWLTGICSSFIGFCCLKNISRFSHIFWIDASSEDAITLGLKGLCFHPDFKVAASLNSVSSQSALAWISSLQSNWLLVFDNADGGPEVVQKFIPSGSKGNILVTSRNKSLSLSQHRVRLMSHPMFKGASQYNHTVYETWDLSLCEIESRARRKTSSQDGNAAHAAILILQTAAFFHHENILEAIFRKASTSFCLKCHKKLDKKVIKSITELLQLGEDQF
jgi:hypothetical protein